MTRRILALVGIVAAAALFYSIWWFALARSVLDHAAIWIEARRAEGWAIDHGALETGGYPFRLIVSVPGAGIETPLWTWRSPMLRGVVKPWDLGHVILSVEGRQSLTLGAGERRIAVTIDAARALASLRHVQGVVRRVDADIKTVAAEAAGLGGRYAAERLQIHIRSNRGEDTERPQGSLDLAASATGATVPAEIAGPLGTMVLTAAIEARIMGQLGASRDGLALWRDDGGTLEVGQLKLVWGPLDASLNATLALDKEWRPLGAGVVKARGYEKTIDAAVGARLIRPVEAQLLRLALAVRAKRDAAAESYVEFPVTAQDGRLFLGPMPVATIPPLF